MKLSERIIQEAQPLSEDEFIPRELLHRKSQLEEVKNELQPVVEDGRERYVIMHGPPGTGKTTLAQYLIEKMEEHTMPFSSAYINCWRKYTRFSVLHGVVDQAGSYRMMDRDLVSSDELVDKVDDIRERRPLIVIVDEADLLQDSEVIYDLIGGNTGLLMLCNEAESMYDMDARTRSRLSGNTSVRFPRYKHSEMLDILDRRRKVALRADALTDEQLDWIADEAAGDARIGIRILRFAAETAQDAGHDSIQDEDIESARSEADTEYRRKNLSKLNRDQRIMYEIVEEEEEIPPGHLYQKYTERDEVEDPVSQRTMQRYLPKMERYNLLELSGRTNARTVTICE